jgi:DNA-binding transcriptional MerR regulator
LPKGSEETAEPTGRRTDGLLTTGEMARLSDATLRTVRFYEEAGLLHPAVRSAGGHRLFPKQELVRLQLISELRAAGFSIEDIRDLLQTKLERPTGAEAARAILQRLEERTRLVKQRIGVLHELLRDLESTRQVLEGCTGCKGHPNYPECCNECERLAALDGIPGAAGVLWHLRDVDEK